jgi:lambda repressor-like predicted transcriptional regulator
MHPAKIQYELKIRDITQKAIALEIGVAEMCVSHEVNGIPVSERIRQAIAKKIDRHPTEVFPGYYFGPRRNRIKKAA